MLSAPNRLTRREDFATAMRRGRRAARRTLVIHLARPPSPETSPLPETALPPETVEFDGPGSQVPPRVGFVVGRPVGGAVVRHRVQRQLRHLMRSRLRGLPDGTLLVVRAQPAAADAGSAVLGDDVDAALRRLT